MKAPIALFTYNRPWHTQQTVEALLKNAETKDSDLIVFSDGKKNSSSDLKVGDVRQYLKTIEGFKSVRIVEREENLGLAQSIISGVTEVVNEYGRVIVLEDDLLTSPYFLKYMNDGLKLYQDDERVISLHGYNYPIKETLPKAFFIKGADCLGWATWDRGWALFEPDGKKLLNELMVRKMLDRFDLFGAYDFSGMLRGQIAGKNQSWAVRWYGSALLYDKLTLYPGRTLIQHIGGDGSGTHCGEDVDGLHSALVSLEVLDIESIPVEENRDALMKICRLLNKTRLGFWRKVARKLFKLSSKWVVSWRALLGRSVE